MAGRATGPPIANRRDSRDKEYKFVSGGYATGKNVVGILHYDVNGYVLYVKRKYLYSNGRRLQTAT